jgi:hypothetical protein
MATNGVNHEQYAAPQTTDAPSNSNSKDLPKDEVGWYFVEQYYTTLSKNPDKLHVGFSLQPFPQNVRHGIDVSSSSSTARTRNLSMGRRLRSFQFKLVARSVFRACLLSVGASAC